LIRLLLDQGLPRSTVAALNAVGWDVVHVADRGMSRSRDAEILDHARRENRICVTLDADFHAILAVTNASGPTVIRIRREGLDGTAIAGLLEAIWPHIELPVTTGAMITVTEHSVRIRHLPISDNPTPLSDNA
jgi:predicted nuclease of predicted toxin-antitoxin system